MNAFHTVTAAALVVACAAAAAQPKSWQPLVEVADPFRQAIEKARGQLGLAQPAPPPAAAATPPATPPPATPATATDSPAPYLSARERVLQREQARQAESGHQGGINAKPGAVPACVKVQQLWDPGLRAVDPNNLVVDNDCSYALFTVRQQVDGTAHVCKTASARQPGSSFFVSKSDAAHWVFCDGRAEKKGYNLCACSPDTNRFTLPAEASGLPIAKKPR